MTMWLRQRHRLFTRWLLSLLILAMTAQSIGLANRAALAATEIGPPTSDADIAVALAASSMAASRDPSAWMLPGAQLVISPATAARLQIQLTQTEAILAEAQLRVQQAQSGQGGLGARPEDIAAAEAKVDAAKVSLRLHQPFADVRFLRGPVLLFDGTTRAAQSMKDACGDLEATARLYVDDQELDTKLHVGVNCPDEQKDALDASIDVQKALKRYAEFELQRYTAPSPQVANFLVPYEQDVKKAELQLQKLKTGGLRDQATLDLNVARAQADVDAIKAALAGSLGGMLQAQLGRARAELKEAQYRVDQAKSGRGGVDVRAEDIGMAEADVATAKANLALFLDPVAEDIGKARATVDGAAAAERNARQTLNACGKGKVTVTLKENDDGEISALQFIRDSLAGRFDRAGLRQRLRQRADDALGDVDPPDFELPLPGLPPIVIDFLRKKLLEVLKQRIEDRLAALGGKIEEVKGKIVRTRELIVATKETLQDLEIVLDAQCTGDQRDQLESAIDEAAALKRVAEQKLKYLTNPSPQIAHYVIPLQQSVIAAEATLQKLKTGGNRDEVTLKLNVATAQADVEGLEAMLRGSLPDLYRAQAVGAQAKLAEANYRIDQAKSGTGGIGARPEDIAVADAAVVTANETLLKIVDLLPELVEAARANVDAKKAAVNTARFERKACDRLSMIETVRLNDDNDNDGGTEIGDKTFMSQSCSGALKDALDFAIDEARAEQEAAEQTLNKLTVPSQKFIDYLVGPASELIKLTTALAQKLRTGGLLDDAALELRRATAQAEVEFWQAAVDGSPRGQATAQVRSAQASLKEAEYRQTQARNGQGGGLARPQDIVIAESLLAIETTKLTAKLNPLPEDILAAEADVHAAQAAVDRARKLRDACDDPTTVSVKKEHRDDRDPDTRRLSHLACAGGAKDAKDAQIDVARADLKSAKMAYQQLTAPTMPQFGYTVEPNRQSVIIATAQLQKMKTGGEKDQITLDTNVAVARANVDRFQATVAGSQGGIVLGWVALSKAVLDEAQYRVTQAQSGQGGPDVRAEDITIAEAEAASKLADFLALMNPLEETVQTARAGLESAEANVRAAEGQRKACNDTEMIGQKKVNGVSGEKRTVTEVDCSDNMKQMFNWGIETAHLQRDIAFQKLKLLTDPGMPEFSYVAIPYQQAAEAAAMNVQKMKNGGAFDRAALDTRVALAQANLEIWTSLLAGNGAGVIKGLIDLATPISIDAQARQAQARASLGGPRERAEDIAIAEANVTARTAELQQYLSPLQEYVEQARLAIESNKAQTQQARYLKRACDDIRLTTTFHDGEDKDGDPKEGRLKVKTDVKCSDDQKDALRALEEGIEGFGLTPQGLNSILTEIDTNEHLQILVAGKKAALAVATADLQKTKTGGNFDASSLQLAVTVGDTSVNCYQAFAVEASQGGLPTPQAPYSWSAPLPCSLAQLPGRLPPFMQQSVTVPTAAP